mmetsp:Transcript_22788/g.76531  ORF Transcript_22788/g.76531 Transcript_22788/m.76531 type:complete len:522 (-) Transcript_22788:19-1584(-)
MRSFHRGRVERGVVVDAAELLEEGSEQLVAVGEVVGAHHLAHGVHAELGHADVARAHADAAGDDGPDGGPAGAVVLHHKLLHGRGGPGRELPHDIGRDAVRGVAHVCVALDHAAPAHDGAVCALVLGPVVGVHRVRVVEGHDEGLAEGHLCHLALRGRAQRLRDAVDGVLHHGPAGALVGGGAHLLVIEECDARDVAIIRPGARRGVDERLEGHKAAREVVEASAEDKLRVSAAQGGGLGVEEGEVEGGDVLRLYAQAGCHELHELGFLLLLKGPTGRPAGGHAALLAVVARAPELALRGEADDGGQVRLLVGRKALSLRCSLQVYAEAGHPQHGLVDGEQPLGRRPGLAVRAARAREHHTADAEVPVEPRVPETATVGDHGHLRHAVRVARPVEREWLGLERGRVRVRANHLEPAASLIRRAHGEGHEGGVAPRVVVLAPGPEGPAPGIRLLQAREAGLFEHLGPDVDGVERGHRRGEELDEAQAALVLGGLGVRRALAVRAIPPAFGHGLRGARRERCL